MAQPAFTARAIVLGSTKLKETDLILTLLSSTGEQLRAVAHGVRKPGSKFGARLEPFSEVDLLLRSGKSLATIGEAKTVTSFAPLRADIAYSAPASALCEIAQKMSYEDAPEPRAYLMTRAALEALCALDAEKPAAIALLVAAYGLKLLAQHGYLPCLDACVFCGEELQGRAQVGEVWFSPDAGGAVCGSCVTDLQGALKVDPALLEWLHTLLYATFDTIATLSCDEQTARQILSLAHSWIVEHGQARLKSLEFMLEFM